MNELSIFALCFSFLRSSKIFVTLNAYLIFYPLRLLFYAFLLHLRWIQQFGYARVFYWVLISVELTLCRNADSYWTGCERCSSMLEVTLLSYYEMLVSFFLLTELGLFPKCCAFLTHLHHELLPFRFFPFPYCPRCAYSF